MAEARLVEAIEALVKRQGREPGPAMPIFKAPQFDGEGDRVLHPAVHGSGYGKSMDRTGPATLLQGILKKRSTRLGRRQM